MSAHSGSTQVKRGLVLNLDPANSRSNIGIGSNKSGVLQPTFGVWGGLTGTSVQYISKYGPGVKLNTAASGGVNWWYNTLGSQPCTANTQYVITARVKWTGTSPNPNLFYIRQQNSGGAQTSESGRFTTATSRLLADGFHYCWAYFTTDADAVSFYIHGYEYTGGMNIWLENLQVRQAGLSDLSGLNNHATFVNNLQHTSLGNGSTIFDGVTDHAIISTFTSKPINQITCASWIYPTNSVGTGVIRGGAISCSSSTYLGIIDSQDGGVTNGLHWAIQTSVGRPSSFVSQIPSNQWSYIVGTYDGAISRAYLNGTQVWASAITGTVSDGTWYIGAYGPQPADDLHNFMGQISQSQIYNIALTTEEVRQNFNSTRSSFGV